MGKWAHGVFFLSGSIFDTRFNYLLHTLYEWWRTHAMLYLVLVPRKYFNESYTVQDVPVIDGNQYMRWMLEIKSFSSWSYS